MARVEEGLRVSVAAGEAVAGSEEGQDVSGRGALGRLPWIAALIIVTLVMAAVGAPLLAPHSPTEQSLPDKLRPPAWQEGGDTKYLLGTDVLGRDVLSRLLYGARVSLIVAAAALLAGGVIGLAVGIVSGYVGGRVDSVLMRVVDATLTFPTILIALLLAVSLGQGLRTMVMAIAVILWARFARVVRGEVLTVKGRDFVALAEVRGCSHVRIMAVHIMPNVMNTFMVLLSLHIGFVILVEASLSFLGAGIPPPTPSWGQMVSDGRSHIASAWWLSFPPGLAILLVVLAFNLFGDWLRDWLDPRLRQQV
jgi:peptide/nickel transport system permease protein